MEYSITTKANWNVEVYDVPVCVAKWITEHLADLDYICVEDVAALAAAVVRSVRRFAQMNLDKVADTIADMEPLPDEWPQYRYERLVCRNGMKPLINMALYHAEHNDRPGIS